MRDGIVLARAPLRVSFVGGGSDLHPRNGWQGVYGAVVSAAIDRHVWCLAKARRDGKFYLSWREKEVVDDPADFHHEIVRACFADLAIRGERFERGMELSFQADVPGGGSGLGSSAATAAACLLALDDLATEGSCIGPGALNEDTIRTLALRCASVQPNAGTMHAGLQDEFATAGGGLRHRTFAPGGVAYIHELGWDNACDQWIRDRFALFSPGAEEGRSAATVLSTYDERKDRSFREGCVYAAAAFAQAIVDRNHDTVMSHVAWHSAAKRDAFSGYSSRRLEQAAEHARAVGAECVKLCGAGGTGHLLAGFKPDNRLNVVSMLEALWGPELPLRITPIGASVMWGWERAW